ncbi:hypothetical protein AOLI_G00231160 [Acnodon oligacanthus]
MHPASVHQKPCMTTPLHISVAVTASSRTSRKRKDWCRFTVSFRDLRLQRYGSRTELPSPPFMDFLQKETALHPCTPPPPQALPTGLANASERSIQLWDSEEHSPDPITGCHWLWIPAIPQE